MKKQNASQQNQRQEKPNGAYQTDGKRVETTEQFRKAFRERKLVIKL